MAPYVKDWRCIVWNGFSVVLMTSAITIAYVVIPPAVDKTKIFAMLAVGATTAPFVERLSCSMDHLPGLISSYFIYIIILSIPSYVFSGYKIGFMDYIYILPIITICFPLYIVYRVLSGLCA